MDAEIFLSSGEKWKKEIICEKRSEAQTAVLTRAKAKKAEKKQKEDEEATYRYTWTVRVCGKKQSYDYKSSSVYAYRPLPN